MPAGRPLPPIIVVSLPKCGTNLIGALFEAIGCQVTGEGIDNKMPWWCERLDTEFVLRFPADTCCVFHSLSVSALNEYATAIWRARGVPKVIFNYRDPRAALVSMINYVLSGRYSGAAWQQIAADILSVVPPDEQIAFGIDYFEEPLFRKYRESAWLLKHPRVLCCSFEKLVGLDGAGSAQEQVDEVDRILRFVEANDEPKAVAARIFDRGARTFAGGQIDSWRQAFADVDLARFDERHGDILRRFGYST